MTCSLGTLLAQTTLSCPSQWAALPVTGVSYHSGQVEPGHIFVAIPGHRHDGHDFIPSAVEKGAAVVFAERPVNCPVPVIITANARIALAEISNAFYRHPSRDLTVVGVTASNGKTTTAFMIDKVLSAVYPRTGLIGTVIVKTGTAVRKADLTTPQSTDLISLLAEMRDNGCSHVTMEVSSAGLQLHRVHGIDFKFATFNNLTREHIDFHGSFEQYFAQKSRLITELADGALAILNGDDAMVAALKDKTKAQTILYSLKGNPADVLIGDVDLATGAGRFTITIPRPIRGPVVDIAPQQLALRLQVLGLHNIYNATTAALVGLANQVPPERIADALAGFTGVERRFQLIYNREFKVIDDHFANAGNIDITLETLNLMQYNNLILLCAIRGSRGTTVNAENAEAIVRWAGKLGLEEIITTDSAEFVGEYDLVTADERKVFIDILSQAGITVHHYPNLTAAIDHALGIVRPEDVLLLAGCQGMDPGARVILPKLCQNLSPQEQKQVLAVLQDRVAGMS